MRQVKVLLVGFLVAVALAVMQAQNFPAINGVPLGGGWSKAGTVLTPSGATDTLSGPGGYLIQRDGTTPQGFEVYTTYTDATNYIKTVIGRSAYMATLQGIMVEGLGTGANPAFLIGTRGAGGIQFAPNGGTAATLVTAGLTLGNASVQGYLLASRSVEAVTTTKTPGTNEGDEVYTNEGDADGATITLPTAVAGQTYTACIQAAQTLTITAAAGDTIRLASGVTAAAGSISSNVIGSCVTLVALNATEWYGVSIVGSWSY